MTLQIHVMHSSTLQWTTQCPLQLHNLHNKTQSVYGSNKMSGCNTIHILDGPKGSRGGKNEPRGNTITSMCTYNVGKFELLRFTERTGKFCFTIV
jgi:hypothetical protein